MFWDNQFRQSNHDILIGLDEVGRGPLAGPVVACACLIAPGDDQVLYQLDELGVTDSKKLSALKRQKILEYLGIQLDQLKTGKVYSILPYSGGQIKLFLTEIDHQQIDEINILQASLLAMKQSALGLINEFASGPDYEFQLLIDGNKVLDLHHPQVHMHAVIKGDSKSLAIGLASIIAKEYRDELMNKLDQIYPGYGLATHAGYPTKAHKLAIGKLGPSAIHRKSFKGVREYVQGHSN